MHELQLTDNDIHVVQMALRGYVSRLYPLASRHLTPRDQKRIERRKWQTERILARLAEMQWRGQR